MLSTAIEGSAISALRLMFSSFGYSAWMFSLIHHRIGSGSPITGPIGVAHKSSRGVSCSFSGAAQSRITNESVSDLQVRLPGTLLPWRAHCLPGTSPTNASAGGRSQRVLSVSFGQMSRLRHPSDGHCGHRTPAERHATL